MSKRITPEEAEWRAGKYLGDANEALERGDPVKADRLFQKAQYWHDRANALLGQGS